MINLCYFIGSFASGGAQKHLLDTVTNLNRKKYNIIFIVFESSGELNKNFVKLGYKIFEVSGALKNYFFFIKRVVGILKTHKIDIIHAHLVGTYFLSMISGYLAKTEIKIISWHSVYKSSKIDYPKSFSSIRFFKYFLFLKIGAMLSDKIIAVSKSVNRENRKFLKVDSRKVKTIYNGINDQYYSNTPVYNDSGKIIIGSTGSLVKDKNFELLIRSVKNFNSNNVKLLIAGDGPEKVHLSSLIKSEQLNNINLVGHIDDVKIFLNKIDIWILPSNREGFSIALLEAMSAGKAIIATNVGGNAEAVRHLTDGLIVPKQNMKSLTKAIELLVNNGKIRQGFKVSARNRYLKNFTLNKMIENIEAVYSE